MARLISVNVGLPRDIQWRGETVHTSIGKEPVKGRRVVRRLNIDGDGQGDLGGHGGVNRPVMVYQLESYRYWEHELGRNDFTFGQFSENFTVEGLADDEVCVGDRYRIGSALFEVSQPRVTCFRLGIRMNEPRMAALVVARHRPGFYLRVIEEGEVGAGDEIVKAGDGPEHVTIAEVDGLLYLPGHERSQLERALRVPALSQGWKGSLQALLVEGNGNAGLTAAAGPPPAWQGFRSLRVARVDRESASVRSFSLGSMDGAALPAGLPGQYLVLRLKPKADGPPVLRNYSMSGRPGADDYRVSVKQEVNGVASTFLHTQVKPGDALEVSAPRGSFTLRTGDGPCVLVSAGIGATPVLAMLDALAACASTREVWWLYGARSGNDHPFAAESRKLLGMLPQGHGCIAYSQPGEEDQPGKDYDFHGHLDIGLMQRLGVPQNGDFYLCGPASFMKSITDALQTWGIPASQIHSEAFGPEESITPGIAKAAAVPVHPPAGKAGPGPQISFTRSGLTVPWDPKFQSLLEFAEACDVQVKWSCRTGVCHMCESVLVSGSVNYSPAPLEAPAEGNLLICCSRPASEIAIDL